jgi:hypothetical protein
VHCVGFVDFECGGFACFVRVGLYYCEGFAVVEILAFEHYSALVGMAFVGHCCRVKVRVPVQVGQAVQVVQGDIYKALKKYI